MKPEIVIDENTGREVVAMTGSRGPTMFDPHNAFQRLSDGKIFVTGQSMPTLCWDEDVVMAKFWFVERGVPETPIVEIGGN